MGITAAFKARILGSHRNIAQAFDSIPASKFDYKPTPAQLSFGYIAQHVASDSYLFCNNFGTMKANVLEKDISTPDSVKARWPKDELESKLKASFACCAHALDLADHYSQLANYMRLNGMVPPSALPRPGRGGN